MNYRFSFLKRAPFPLLILLMATSATADSRLSKRMIDNEASVSTNKVTTRKNKSAHRSGLSSRLAKKPDNPSFRINSQRRKGFIKGKMDETDCAVLYNMKPGEIVLRSEIDPLNCKNFQVTCPTTLTSNLNNGVESIFSCSDLGSTLTCLMGGEADPCFTEDELETIAKDICNLDSNCIRACIEINVFGGEGEACTYEPPCVENGDILDCETTGTPELPAPPSGELDDELDEAETGIAITAEGASKRKYRFSQRRALQKSRN